MSEPIFEINKYLNKSAVVNISGSKEVRTHVIELKVGWSIIGTYIDLSTLTSASDGGGSLDVSLIFASLPDGCVVKDYLGNVFIPSFSLNTIGDWFDTVNGLGYTTALQVFNSTTSPLYITLEGELNYTDSSNSLYGSSMSIPSLWSLIPWLLPYKANAIDVFSGYPDIDIVMDEDGNMYKPKTGFNSIGNLTPGKGYYVRAFNSFSLDLSSDKYKRGGYANYIKDSIPSDSFSDIVTESYFNVSLSKGVVESFMAKLPLDEHSTNIYLKELRFQGLTESKFIIDYIITNGYRKSFFDFGDSSLLRKILSEDASFSRFNYDSFSVYWDKVQSNLASNDLYCLSITNSSDVVVAKSKSWSGGSTVKGEVTCKCSIGASNNINLGDIFYVYLNNNNKKYKMTLTYDLANSNPDTNPGIVYDRGFQLVSSVSISEPFNSIVIKK